MDNLFKLTGRKRYHWPAIDVTVSRDEDPFLFIADEERKELLLERDAFEHVPGDTLEAALEDDVDDVTAAIESGEWDEILDFLLYAEQEAEPRPPVCEAIVHRSETLKLQRENDDTSIDPTGLTVGR
ncbi:hypothetical protein [Natrinema halophilum]|uniref:Uncharacterized protein n=1 Tax=Natrinema halophilum TaxID=1699371 RepID=A0A7D5GHG1_9EURY|nr:hypothetical protein [Natrinema halophilum]QLG49094.1 hypothetical protein HYG82_09645 [Natrinema halophilum]